MEICGGQGQIIDLLEEPDLGDRNKRGGGRFKIGLAMFS